MEQAYRLLGLAKKAGKLISGEKNCRQAIASGACALAVIANDVSENARKAILNSCKYYDVPLMEAGPMETLGHSIGTSFSAAVAVMDEGLAKLISAALVRNLNGGGRDGTTQNI